MVGNRQPLKVRREGRVRPGDAPDIACMVDGRVKVGVIANPGGHGVFNLTHLDKTASQRVGLRRRCPDFKQGEQTVAKGLPCKWPHRKKFVQRCLRTGPGGEQSQTGQRVAVAQAGQVNDLVANCHAATKGLALCDSAEDGEGQVLNREIAVGCIGRLDPALGGRVVGVVQRGQVDGHVRLFLKNFLINYAAAIRRSSKIATARIQPADAPRILCEKHEM